MKNKTLKYFSDKNKGKLKKGLAIGAGAGLGTALGGSYLINKEASDKLDGVSDNIKSIEGLTDSQRINMQKKLDMKKYIQRLKYMKKYIQRLKYMKKYIQRLKYMKKKY